MHHMPLLPLKLIINLYFNEKLKSHSSNRCMRYSKENARENVIDDTEKYQRNNFRAFIELYPMAEHLELYGGIEWLLQSN